MALAGENGAGKTTLLNHILEPDIFYQGRILIDGKDMKKTGMPAWKGLLSCQMATGCQRFIQYGVFAICTGDFIIIGTGRG